VRYELAQNIYYGNRVQGPCRKLLSILLEIDRAKDLKRLMEQGMCDDCQPLLMGDRNHDGEFRLHCHLHDRVHKRIEDFEPFVREQFALWSRRLTPPYITWEPNSKHKHYVLQQGDPLPMVRYDWDGDGAYKVMPDEGKFSQVTRVRIDSSWVKFSDHAVGFTPECLAEC